MKNLIKMVWHALGFELTRLVFWVSCMCAFIERNPSQTGWYSLIILAILITGWSIERQIQRSIANLQVKVNVDMVVFRRMAEEQPTRRYDA